MAKTGNETDQSGGVGTKRWDIIKQQIGDKAPFAAALGNFALQMKGYKNIADRKKQLQPRLFGPAYTRVDPIRGLPIEVSQNYLERIPQEVERYADPTLTLAAKGQQNQYKQEALDKLAAMEAQTVMGERTRFGQEMMRQQMENIRRGDENLSKLEAKDKADMVADVEWEDKKRQTFGQGMTAFQEGMHNEAAGNYAAEELDRKNKIDALTVEISGLEGELLVLDPTVAANMGEIGRIKAALVLKREDLVREQNIKAKTPTKIREGLLFKWGGRLLSRL